MLAWIAKGDPEEAGEIWYSDQRHDRREEIGIKAILQAQTSVHDLMIYFLLCGYFHAMSGGDKAAAVRGIESYHAKVATYATERDPSLLPLVVNDWMFALTHLFFPSPIPKAALQNVTACAQRAGVPLRLPERKQLPGGGLVADIRARFPDPSPWRIDWA
jgi:hypothetical protein